MFEPPLRARCKEGCNCRRKSAPVAYLCWSAALLDCRMCDFPMDSITIFEPDGDSTDTKLWSKFISLITSPCGGGASQTPPAVFKTVNPLPVVEARGHPSLQELLQPWHRAAWSCWRRSNRSASPREPTCDLFWRASLGMTREDRWRTWVDSG